MVKIKNKQTPESGTEDLGVELLLVLADLGGVALWPDVGGVDVDHGALPVVLPLDLLALAACWNSTGHAVLGPEEPPHIVTKLV